MLTGLRRMRKDCREKLRAKYVEKTMACTGNDPVGAWDKLALWIYGRLLSERKEKRAG